MSKSILVGIDLGGTTTKLALVSLQGDLVYEWEIPTDTSQNGRFIVSNIAQSLKQTIEERSCNVSAIAGIGIGAPGPVDLELGIVYEAVNLGWSNQYPLKKLLEEATSLPVFIENDANCAALGEMWKGAGEGAKDLVCVTLGTGVGGGVITGGEIVHGISGAGGEIGHITSILEGGAPCNCGKKGCLETIASATGIARIATQVVVADNVKSELVTLYREQEYITAKNVFDIAKLGDTTAQKIINDVTIHLGVALANIANTLNPEKVVIGGGVSKAGTYLLTPLNQHFQQFAFPRVAKSTKLVLATLGNSAGVMGAAWLVKHNAMK